MTQTVLILGGNGKIGSHAARAFAQAGWTVRHYDRATNDMTTAARGCDVIVNGLNPPNYHNWAKLIPKITAQVIDAARASGATVIIPGNVYSFGPDTRIIDAGTPQAPITRKGKVRQEMEETYRRSGVQVINLRAGSFIDPDQNGDLLTLALLKDVRKGRLTALGPRHVPHAFTYLPDWARAAQQLAERRATLATWEDVPMPGPSLSMDDFQKTYEAMLGQSLKITAFPWWLMTVLGPVWELAREMGEMRYLYAMPHELSGRRMKELLPDFTNTPLDEVMASALPADVYPDKAMRPGGKAILAE